MALYSKHGQDFYCHGIRHAKRVPRTGRKQTICGANALSTKVHTPGKSPRLHCFFLRPCASVCGTIHHEWAKSIVLGVLCCRLGWHTSGNIFIKKMMRVQFVEKPCGLSELSLVRLWFCDTTLTKWFCEFDNITLYSWLSNDVQPLEVIFNRDNHMTFPC